MEISYIWGRGTIISNTGSKKLAIWGSALTCRIKRITYHSHVLLSQKGSHVQYSLAKPQYIPCMFPWASTKTIQALETRD